MTLLALVPVLESVRSTLIRSAFATFGQKAPTCVSGRGVVYSPDGTIALCALTSKPYFGAGGASRACFSIRLGSYRKLEAAVQDMQTAAVALATDGASFLFPWPRLSPLVRAEFDKGGTKYQILIELRDNGWALVQERGVRENIDSFLIKAA